MLSFRVLALLTTTGERMPLPYSCESITKIAPVTILRSKGLQTDFFVNVLSQTTEGQTAPVASKLALMAAVISIVSGRQEYDFARNAFLSMPMTRDVIARVRIGNLIEPGIESYLLDTIAV